MSKLKEEVSERDRKAFERFLGEDEELIFATSFGKTYLRQKFLYYIFVPNGVFMLFGFGLAYLFKFNLGIGLLIGLIAACFGAYLKTLHLYHANRYLLTTRRVIIKKGIFAVKLVSSLYDKITHIEVDQNFYNRIVMHYGHVIINTAGATKDEIVLKYIDNPVEFKNLLERLINKERDRYGRPTGPVVTVEGELIE